MGMNSDNDLYENKKTKKLRKLPAIFLILCLSLLLSIPIMLSLPVYLIVLLPFILTVVTAISLIVAAKGNNALAIAKKGDITDSYSLCCNQLVTDDKTNKLLNQSVDNKSSVHEAGFLPQSQKILDKSEERKMLDESYKILDEMKEQRKQMDKKMDLLVAFFEAHKCEKASNKNGGVNSNVVNNNMLSRPF
jgi:hypothetical protein